MGTYPIRILKKSLDHQGGTKSYHTVIALTADGRTLLVKRWGRMNSYGSIEVITGPAGLTEGAKIVRDKQKRGYDEVDHKDLQADDLDEFKRLMTPRLYTSIGPANLAYLIPDADTTGIKDAANVEWEKNPDGTTSIKQKTPMPLPSPPEETIAEKVARNPLWGAF